MRRFLWIQRVTALAFLVPLPFVWRFFVGERFYPHTPLLPAMGKLPFLIDLLCFSGMVLLLLGILILPQPRRSLGAFLVLALGFSLWDQSRWMPYFYQFYFMFFVLYGYHRRNPDRESESRHETPDEPALNTLQVLNFGIWFWSGLHKISAAYVGIGYRWMIEPLLKYLPENFHSLMLSTAPLSPMVETGGALLLLFPRSRTLGVLLLTAMHIAILVIFGPFGTNWNPSVWSWNVAMICFLWLFFWRTSTTPLEIFLGTFKEKADKLFHRLIACMFVFLPALNSAGYWDDFLSHCLYSWTTREAEIAVQPEAESLLPEEVKANLRKDQTPGIVPVLNWSFSVFESPPYHSYRVFYRVFGALCAHTQGSQGLEFRIFEKPEWRTARTEVIRYQCAPEQGPEAIREIGRDMLKPWK